MIQGSKTGHSSFSAKALNLLNRIGLALLLALSSLAINSSWADAFDSKSFVYPIMDPRISSKFGTRNHPVLRATRHHNGLDMAAPRGAQIRAVRAGVVVFADPYAGYGKLVVIKHPDGLTTHYGHCETIKAKPGQKVTAGQIIATVGSTGMVTGPHLHFEVRINGKPQNPEKYIPGLRSEAKG